MPGMNDPTDQAHLQSVTQELIKAITSPQVMEQMRQFREKAAAGSSHQDAGELMALESLRAAGAKLPDGFRITSRTFEDKTNRTKVDLGPAPSSDMKALGNTSEVSGCAGGGGLSVCGCAGGGT